MSSYFLKSGKTFRVTSKEAMDLHEKLPAKNFIVKADMMGNLFLEEIESFTPVKKMYGKTVNHTDRILNTFHSRPAGTGVMLVGEKGSGKSLLAKNLSIEGAKQGIPTIVINSAWHGDNFNNLLQQITQPCIVLFDEFEKVYDDKEQEEILTLLDGVYNSKKLYAFTCNNKWRVDQHMRNRPGRIFYMLDFKGLDSQFITEYCQDNLNAKQHIEKICQIASLFSEFNFDMLKALVEEMNRYDETPQEALTMLNAKPEFSGDVKYTVQVFHGEQELFRGPSSGKNSPMIFNGNPLSAEGVYVEYYDPEMTEDEDDDDCHFSPTLSKGSAVETKGGWVYKTLLPTALVKVDSKQGMFIFQDNGTSVVLTKAQEKKITFDHLAF
jgi:hypothetical protein